jgi:hypothetical protein
MRHPFLIILLLFVDSWGAGSSRLVIKRPKELVRRRKRTEAPELE